MTHLNDLICVIDVQQPLIMDADGTSRCRVLVILVQAVLVHGQAQVADLPETYLLPGFRLQLLVADWEIGECEIWLKKENERELTCSNSELMDIIAALAG